MNVLLFSCSVFLLTGCSALGTRPNAEDQARFESSLQYSKEKSIFVNRRPHIMEEIPKRVRFADYVEALFGEKKDQLPPQPLPEVKPDLAVFLKPDENIKVLWLGHSSLMINIGGKVVLIDPVFSDHASPLPFVAKRFQKPVLALTEIPPIDYVVISHDHYDHLDMQSVQFFKDKNTHFVVPLGISSHLKGWGIDPNKITELDWWKNYKTDGLEFVAAPAQHSSGRDRIHFNETLWASWVVRSGRRSFYFSGDSGYDSHFKAIGDRYGPFDVAFIENGQYNEKWREAHLLPAETIQAFFDLRAKRLFPVHWGMFSLAPHAWDEPVAKTGAMAKEKGINFVSPKIGEVVELGDP